MSKSTFVDNFLYNNTNNNNTNSNAPEVIHQQLEHLLSEARVKIKQLQEMNEFPKINQYFTREDAMALVAKYLFPIEERNTNNNNNNNMPIGGMNFANPVDNNNNNAYFGFDNVMEEEKKNNNNNNTNNFWGVPSPDEVAPPHHNNNNNKGGKKEKENHNNNNQNNNNNNNNDVNDVIKQNLADSAKVLDSGNMLAFVEFKRGRVRKYISHIKNIIPGIYVLVDGDRGSDCGLLVQTIMKEDTGAEDAPVSITSMDGCEIRDEKIKLENGKIIRVASDEDIDKLHNVICKAEQVALKTCKQRCSDLGIDINMLDVEYQFDMKKISFFFDADHSVDFRELVRELYRTFGARIWMENVNPHVKNAMPGEEGYNENNNQNNNNNNRNNNNNENNGNRGGNNNNYHNGGNRRGGGGNRYNKKKEYY
ncbi:PSP1 C-terminal conserved region containing protein, putative [Angomonas deanei]|uniref:PSP1 C-terminal conserved region containing protein, putative n=1 Tax=Angomonas deanei TaxID=59799 RepID=A0A7G2C754_9TRYP|nr:PSP1 C-terminal conserved region containing protein, putative [Angomonas deanei]